MKCSACWAEKAYRREVAGWRGAFYRWLGIVPLKCQHCHHKFVVPRVLTIGQRVVPPPLRTASHLDDRPSYASQHLARRDVRAKVIAPRASSKQA